MRFDPAETTTYKLEMPTPASFVGLLTVMFENGKVETFKYDTIMVMNYPNTGYVQVQTVFGGAVTTVRCTEFYYTEPERVIDPAAGETYPLPVGGDER